MTASDHVLSLQGAVVMAIKATVVLVVLLLLLLLLLLSLLFHELFNPCSVMPHSSFGSVQDLRTEDRWFDPPARPKFILRIDDSHCDRIHPPLTTVHYFDDGYVGKQSVAWKEY